MATTEHITVLFTDLAGSTELQSSLAPDAADEVRKKHFSGLRQAIAGSGGTEVKNLGDGLMVVFPAASSALACAVAMQQVVHRDNIGAEHQLGLRVGLSSGEATKEEDDYFGDPVIEAARLCAKADAGEILATDIVKMSAGRRSSHDFNSVGALELKGLPDPVETFEVAWVPLGDDVLVPGRVSLPVRLRHVPAVGVIGREDELATLEAAAKRVGSGEGREVILLAGEPGQGKTTLAAEFARRVYEARMTVLFGRCDEEVNAPYGPFREALSHLVSHVDEAILRSYVEAHGGELDRMVPALRQRLGDVPPPRSSDDDTERYLLYAAVTGLLERSSADTPILLVLDDLHWADKPSLQLLRHLVAHSEIQRLLIVGSYRDGELSSAHPLLEAVAALHREPGGISRISLRGLDDTGVIAFMEAAAGHQLDDVGVGLAHQLYRETDGNPFFVAEVLRHLSESGAIYQDAETGRWVASERGQLTLPHSVRSVIGSRVSRLGDHAARVLSTASVIGRDFDLKLLAEVTHADPDELLDLLEEAQHAALVHELRDVAGRYTFSHALVQHTLYDDLGPTRRTRTHRQVGEAIEELHPNAGDEFAGELARHFFLATKPADAGKAVAYAQRAGNAALRALAPDDAVRYFSQALELASQSSELEPSLHIDLLIGLGNAQRQAGIAESRESLLQAARAAKDLDDTERLVAAALANSRGWFSSLGRVDTEKVEVLKAALDRLSDTKSPERAHLLATLSGELVYGSTLQERLDLVDEAQAIARQLGDMTTLCEVLVRCWSSIDTPPMLERLLSEMAEVEALAEDLDHPVARFNAAHMGSFTALRGGQFELADERLAVARSLASKLQQPDFIWRATYTSASRAFSRGDVAQADELASTALEVGTSSGQPDAFGFYAIYLGGRNIHQGTFGDFEATVSELAEQFPAIPAYMASLAFSRLEAGNAAGAKELIDRAAAQSFTFPEDIGWFDAAVSYARVAIELRLADHASALFDLLAPFHNQVPNTSILILEPVATFLGGLGGVLRRYEEAEAFFQEAQELNTRGEMPFADASTKVLWGRMLSERGEPGDAERARAMLIEARDIASRRGYAAVERRAAAELATLR